MTKQDPARSLNTKALRSRVLARFSHHNTHNQKEPVMNEPLLEGARLSGRLEAGLLKACLTQT
ncbi:MAG: hypothetical protein ACO264_12945, partial [Burkholderiaceae bacterium]